MQYRKFGKLDWEVSALGFGAMRLPVVNKNHSNVDEPEAIRMMRYAFDHGVNYVDSSYGYHQGNSEVVIGKALKDGYREKVRVATKLQSGEVHTAEDFDRCLNEQLKRLQTDRIDFYLLHHLNKAAWPKLRDLGVLSWADSAISDGRISYFGFSFHDTYDVFQDIIDSYNWTLCQIQYNYMDEALNPGTRGLQYAHEKGLAVVVMEPIRGGRLTRPPSIVAELWTSAPVQRTPQEWALRWVWNHPEVTLVLSGMNNMEQVVENVGYAEHSQPHNLTTSDLELIAQVRDAYRSLGPASCTGCGYCMPCPNGVDIPHIFDLYNEAMIYNSPEKPRKYYSDKREIKEEQRSDRCIKCEQCLGKCPQKIPITDLLEKAHVFLTGKI